MVCAIYCRLSKEDEDRTQPSESIQNQKSMLIQYAMEQGWEIYGIYCDEDYSGADRDRPEWQDLLSHAQQGKFQIVLCKNQSRFTRDLEMVEKYIHGLFALWGIRFVAVLDNIDTQVKGNKKARQISGLINEWYLEDLSENIRAVLDSKRKAGKYIGSFAPYGYKKDPLDHNHLVVDEIAAQTVHQIFALYLEGAGTHRIAQLLNQQGVLSPSRYKQAQGLGYVNGNASVHPGQWNHTTVARILKNQVYLGDLVQGVKRKASYKSKKLLSIPENGWIRVESTHEPLVDKKTFEAVQQRMNKGVRAEKNGYAHLLANLVHCARCGSTMQRLGHTYKGIPKAYLQCRMYAANRQNPQCTGQTIRLDQLTVAVENSIRGYTAAYYRCSPIWELEGRHGQDLQRQRLQKQRSGLVQQEQRLGQAVKALYLDKVEGVISPQQFLELNHSLQQDLARIQQQIKAVEDTIAALEQQAADGDAHPSSQDRVLNSIPRQLVELLVERIEVGEKDRQSGRQAVVIHWRF